MRIGWYPITGLHTGERGGNVLGKLSEAGGCWEQTTVTRSRLLSEIFKSSEEAEQKYKEEKETLPPWLATEGSIMLGPCSPTRIGRGESLSFGQDLFKLFRDQTAASRDSKLKFWVFVKGFWFWLDDSNCHICGECLKSVPKLIQSNWSRHSNIITGGQWWVQKMRQMSSLVPFIQTQLGSWRSGDALTHFFTSDLGLSDENSPILKRVGEPD